ncbi:oligosaccharide flippase family protein [Dyadobacter sp. NIV53]|uniref:oligosaccharide flippase family protein n=1 Tax=Dyadobacter sp. NIV53 TaxID=2861765 RepID=UPI001C869A69|nr:oligosaccharide flippase family protein [Dyadobacter sp. NIV53]
MTTIPYKGLLRKLDTYKQMVANFGYLSILQIFNMAFPLLTYPYLLRVLGAETYGMVVYAQALVGYLVVMVNFGFNITATKEISINRDNSEKINEIVSSVFIVKGILFLLSFLLLSAALFYIKEIQPYSILFYLTLWMCLYEFLFPVWYFHGTERMKYITFLTLASRLTFISLIFLFVHTKQDYTLVPVINGVGAISSCIIAWIILKRNNVQIRLQPVSTLFYYVRKAYIMALANISNIFKTNFNLVVVKYFFSFKEVAYFDLAIKISNLGITFLDLISQTIFPKMSRVKDSKFLIKMLKLSFIAALFMVISIHLFGDIIISIIGGANMESATNILKILSLNLPIYIIGALLGRNCLLINGYDNHILYSMALSSILYLVMVLATYYLFPTNMVNNIAVVYVLSFLFETIYRYKVCSLKKLI